VDKKIFNIRELLPLLEAIAKGGRQLLIVAEADVNYNHQLAWWLGGNATRLMGGSTNRKASWR
jgi:hypothetical protein